MEEWKDIPGYEGLYQVSDQGRVRSLDRIVVNSRNVYRTLKGRILRPLKYRNGYFYIVLSKDNHRKNCRVHRLVARAFIPNPENKPHLDHINTKRDDNRVENLRWTTAKENVNNPLSIKHLSDAMKGDKHPMYGKLGKDNPTSKAIYQISKDGNIIRKWGGMREAERHTGTKQKKISLCCQGKRRTTGGYRWIYAEALDDFLIDKMNKTIEKRKRIA